MNTYIINKVWDMRLILEFTLNELYIRGILIENVIFNIYDISKYLLIKSVD